MEQLIVVVWDSCQHWSKSPKDVDLPVSNKLAEMKMWYLAANIIIKNDPKLTKITIFFANLTELLLKSDLFVPDPGWNRPILLCNENKT